MGSVGPFGRNWAAPWAQFGRLGAVGPPFGHKWAAVWAQFGCLGTDWPPFGRSSGRIWAQLNRRLGAVEPTFGRIGIADVIGMLILLSHSHYFVYVKLIKTLN